MRRSNSLLEQLIKANVIEKEALTDEQTLHSPWYIQILSAFFGWLSSLFLLGFCALFVLDSIDEPVVIGSLGIVLVAMAYFILKSAASYFLEHLGLALSLAGQVAVAYFLLIDEQNWLIFGVFHLVLAVVMPNFIHRVFSVIFAAISFDVGLLMVGIADVLSSVALMTLVVFSLNEFKYLRFYQQMSAVIYGLVIYWLTIRCFSSYIVDVLASLSNNRELLAFPYQISQVLFVIAIMFSVLMLMMSNKSSLRSPYIIATLVLALAVILLTLQATGISAAIIIILLGFSRSNRIMMAMGIIALLSYCSVYYYSMEQTLLYKSVIFLGIAVMMLIIRFAMTRFTLTDLRQKIEAET